MMNCQLFGTIIWLGLASTAYAQTQSEFSRSQVAIKKCDDMGKFESMECRDNLEKQLKSRLNKLELEYKMSLKESTSGLPGIDENLVKSFDEAERLWYQFSVEDCTSSAGLFGGSGQGAASHTCILQRYTMRIRTLQFRIKNPK